MVMVAHNTDNELMGTFKEFASYISIKKKKKVSGPGVLG